MAPNYNLQPFQQLVRKFPLFASPFFRDRDLWQDLEEGLLSQQRTGGGVTVYEQGNQLIVEAELPGAHPDDIEITYTKGVLNIRCQQLEESGTEKEPKKAEKSTEKRYYFRSQRSWAYSVNLPVAVDDTKEPQANFKDGIMRITFNKAQKDTVKRIQIKKS